jgi:hypothetical protein
LLSRNRENIMDHMKVNGVRFAFLKKTKQGEIITSKSAASWLRQGGFAWRTEDKHNTPSDHEMESNSESKPRGLRQNRKTLARAKYLAVIPDEDSGEDNGSLIDSK